MNDLLINGLDEITNFIGTRKEIYHLIAKYNPLAIIDFRQATVKIEKDTYLIILKKVNNAFKIRLIWRVTTGDQKQFYFD